ncbi:MAG: hypothetical protein Q8R02_23495 [Hyphomonadaceae bacterium]|nr:hypothetical protein [Hyphomonadaceae bacterium]
MSTATIGAKVDGPVSSLTDGRSFGLGDRFTDKDGKEYVWIQASGAITAVGYVVIIDETYQAAEVTTSNDAEGDLLGVAVAAFADNDYGWVQVKGPCLVQVSASCAANVVLNTTATAGQLDDDGGVTALRARGIYLTTSRGGSAGTAAGLVNWPIMVDDGTGYTDGVTPGTAANNKALVLGASGEISTITTATITNLTTTALTMGATAVTATGTELNYLDIATLGTGVASKAVVLDAGDDYTWPATGVLTTGVVNDVAGTGLAATHAEINRAADLSARIVVLTATAAITEVLHEGKTLVMREAGGNALCTFTLPAATGGGGRYRFVVDEVNTSNYVIAAVAGADVFRGVIMGNDGAAATTAWRWIAGATDDTVTLNGTTTGGVTRGDWVEFEDIAADGWAVRGSISQSGAEATPFSDAVA